MQHSPQIPFARQIPALSLLLSGVLAISAAPISAHPPGPQDPPPAASSTQSQAQPAKPQEPASSENAEMSSRDTAPTFKVRVNLVLVRVVVRDSKGNIIP